mgnify:CR=1 FL=1
MNYRIYVESQTGKVESTVVKKYYVQKRKYGIWSTIADFDGIAGEFKSEDAAEKFIMERLKNSLKTHYVQLD